MSNSEKDAAQVNEPDGNIHTVPTNSIGHIESSQCYCAPTLTYKDLITGVECWTHTDTRKEALQ